MTDLEKVVSAKASNAKGAGAPPFSVVLTTLAVSEILQQKLTSAASESA